MSLLLDLLTFPVTGPVKGITWIAKKISEQADSVLYSEDSIRGKLLELELQLDMGEISEQDYDLQEENLLSMLKIARERRASESE
ncbi:MAG: gas vesicle protein GvpG [Chloroflexi bacterium]|nr:gas vesicle protein GvpG [Chloroflexota bacterium]